MTLACQELSRSNPGIHQLDGGSTAIKDTLSGTETVLCRSDRNGIEYYRILARIHPLS